MKMLKDSAQLPDSKLSLPDLNGRQVSIASIHTAFLVKDAGQLVGTLQVTSTKSPKAVTKMTINGHFLVIEVLTKALQPVEVAIPLTNVIHSILA